MNNRKLRVVNHITTIVDDDRSDRETIAIESHESQGDRVYIQIASHRVQVEARLLAVAVENCLAEGGR